MDAITTLPRWSDKNGPTIGYGVIAWVEDNLVQPDGPDAGGAFRLSQEQVNFLLHWYSFDPQSLRFVYRRGVLRRSKGAGKTPFMAAVAIAELVGPVRPTPSSAATGIGAPVPVPWVNLAGVSEAQTANTLTSILAMLEGAPATTNYSLDVGLTRIYTPSGGRLVPITASSKTQEGGRPTFAVLDETQHWHASDGGHELARVIRRNLAKSRDGSARAIESTNAHEPGAESIGEASYRDYLAILEGRSRATGLLYDSREAPPGVNLADPDELLDALRAAYGDAAAWVDLERIRDEVYDPSTPVAEARRFYLNQVVAADDALVAPAEWAANKDDALTLKVSPPGRWQTADAVTLGFDGSRRDDSTALVARRLQDGAAFLLGLWEKPRGPAGEGWEVDHAAVRGAVDHAFATLDVRAFFADVAEWETDVDAWADEYRERLMVKASPRHAVAYDMRTHQADTVRANEALVRAIVDRELPHNGDPALTRHVLNARRRPNRWGVGFGKSSRESVDKVDAYAAMLLASIARTAVLATGRPVATPGLVGFR